MIRISFASEFMPPAPARVRVALFFGERVDAGKANDIIDLLRDAVLIVRNLLGEPPQAVGDTAVEDVRAKPIRRKSN